MPKLNTLFMEFDLQQNLLLDFLINLNCKTKSKKNHFLILNIIITPNFQLKLMS